MRVALFVTCIADTVYPEAARATVEHKFSKAQILDLYLNRVYFGAGAYGVEAAAQRYFGKSARQVTLAEAALLAGMIQRPNYFSPYRHPDRAIERRNLVLDSMVETGAITKQQAEHAQAESLHLSTTSVDASRKGSTPMSSRRGTAPGASLVWSVEKTK